MNILCIGNSFSQDATRYLHQVSGEEIFVRNLYIGGCSLERHYNNIVGNIADYDYQKNGRFLKADTLIHGDYCLPNIMLDDWKFTGFVDLDSGGVGDKHIDLFWGIWTLWFNLKTNKYKDRFIDAYGRENVEEELLRTVAAAEIFG